MYEIDSKWKKNDLEETIVDTSSRLENGASTSIPVRVGCLYLEK